VLRLVASQRQNLPHAHRSGLRLHPWRLRLDLWIRLL
jgi:hypothetical protein